MEEKLYLMLKNPEFEAILNYITCCPLFARNKLAENNDLAIHSNFHSPGTTIETELAGGKSDLRMIDSQKFAIHSSYAIYEFALPYQY